MINGFRVQAENLNAIYGYEIVVRRFKFLDIYLLLFKNYPNNRIQKLKMHLHHICDGDV